MTVPREFTISATATLLDAAARIEANHSRSVFVMAGDVVEGVISEGDILRALLRGADVRAPLRDFVHHDFKFLTAWDDAKALELMRRYGITLVPVVDGHLKLVSVIRLQDLLGRVILSGA